MAADLARAIHFFFACHTNLEYIVVDSGYDTLKNTSHYSTLLDYTPIKKCTIHAKLDRE